MSGAKSAVALGIGFGLGLPGVGGAWASPGSILDLDLAGGRFAHAGRTYPSQAALLAAIGGSESGGTITIGPYVAPDAPELLSNGDFAEGTAGWSATQSAPGAGGATAALAVSDGVGTITGNGANCPAAMHPFTVAVGRAYLGRGKLRCNGPNTLRPHHWYTNLATGDSSLGAQGVQATGPDWVEAVNTFTTVGSSTILYMGGRAIIEPGNGAFDLSDFSCKECTPFAGFVPGAVSGFIAATTPAAAGDSKVLWQTDDGMTGVAGPAEYNHIRICWGADRHLHLLVSHQTAQEGIVTTQADLDLGVVEVATPFRIAFSAAPDSFIASLDGQPAMVATAGTFPGAAIMRLGRSQTMANNWDGAISRVTIWPDAKPAAVVENLAAPDVARLIAAWGDSLTAGAGATGGSSYPAVASAAFSPSRPVANQGIGGQTSTAIGARQGGISVALTVAGNRIPASGAVAIIARNVGGSSADNAGPITDQGAQTLNGWLAGIYGVLARDGSWNYTFTRAEAGDQVDCPPGSVFTPEQAVQFRGRSQWLWLGRNGAVAGRTVEQDIAACVAYLGHDRYLVGSILLGAGDGGGGQAAMEATNATLAASYGPRFVDLMETLMAASDASPTDHADVAARHVPASLRSDAIHLNDAGYAVVAAAFRTAHEAMGW